MMYLFFYVCLCKPRTFSTCPCANPITATRTCHSTSLHAPNNHHAFIYNINVPLFMRLVSNTIKHLSEYTYKLVILQFYFR